MTTLYTAIDNNYDKLFTLLSTDTELLSHISSTNFYRDDAPFYDKTWPFGVSILDPIITWGEQSFGLTGYTLTYNIHVYTKQLPADQSRDMLNKIMHRIIELCDLKTNTDLTGTCTQMDVIHANPNKKMLVSGKTVRRMGEIRVQTLLTLQL